MATLKLANELNLVVTVKVEEQKKATEQILKYLIIIDFEATCWQNKCQRKSSPYNEIIEFPAVLYDIQNEKIIEEFRQYVQPTENPFLSEFCKKLTGITQDQVDAGVPIGTCLMLFKQWLQNQYEKYDLTFESHNKKKQCAFVTWSDWDLGNCLKFECLRKKLEFPNVMKKWMNLKELYCKFYCRRPNGLKGALNDLGLPFIGQEHCGLTDARNTAYLACRMIKDGIVLRNTTL